MLLTYGFKLIHSDHLLLGNSPGLNQLSNIFFEWLRVIIIRWIAVFKLLPSRERSPVLPSLGLRPLLIELTLVDRLVELNVLHVSLVKLIRCNIIGFFHFLILILIGVVFDTERNGRITVFFYLGIASTFIEVLLDVLHEVFQLLRYGYVTRMVGADIFGVVRQSTVFNHVRYVMLLISLLELLSWNLLTGIVIVIDGACEVILVFTSVLLTIEII